MCCFLLDLTTRDIFCRDIDNATKRQHVRASVTTKILKNGKATVNEEATTNIAKMQQATVFWPENIGTLSRQFVEWPVLLPTTIHVYL